MGNPVAVILDSDGLTGEQMQRIARWTNLSETTFITPATSSDADYALRIFTPNSEIPFAGHPTLGSAHAWHEQHPEHTADHIIQQCGAGLVEIRTINGQYFFKAPDTIRSGPLSDAELDHLTAGLGITRTDVVAHQWVDNGPGWAGIQLASAAQVTALEPNFNLLNDALVGVVGPHHTGSPHTFEVRAFAPGVGVLEDPITGSLNASLAQWLIREGAAPNTYTATQGGNLHRAGVVTTTTDDEGAVWVGGATTTIVSGEIVPLM